MVNKADTPKPSQKQADKFKEAARKLGLDESEKALEKAFGKIDPKKSPK
jgi:hypothetical protein